MNEGQIMVLPKMTDKVIKYRERHKKCVYCKHLKLVFPKIDSVPAYFNCMAKGKIIRDTLPDMTNIRRICSCYEVDESKYE